MKIGNIDINDLKLRNINVRKVYNGNELIWTQDFLLRSVDFDHTINNFETISFNPSTNESELLTLSTIGIVGTRRWVFSEPVSITGVGTVSTTTLLNPEIRFLSQGVKSISLLFDGNFSDSITKTYISQPVRVYFGGVFTTYNDGIVNKTSSAFVSTEINLLNRSTFDIGTGFTSSVDISGIIEEDDNNLMVCGGFTLFRGSANSRVARIGIDGSRPSTQPVSNITNGTGHNLIKVGTNDYIVSGSFTNPTNRIIRITNNSVNSTFSTNLGTGLDNTTWPYALTIINNIVFVGGNFTEFNGVSANRIVGLNINGTRNTSFNYGTGFNAWSYYFDTYDNLLYCGGLFTEYNGTSTPARFVALNLDGTINNTFPNLTIGNNGLFTFDRIDENRWVLGGTFTLANGGSQNRIVIIDNEGNIDTSFNIGTGFNSGVRQLKVFRNKIYCAGDFTDYNGTAVNRVIVLNLDGSVFIAPPGFNNIIRNLLITKENVPTGFNIGTGFNAQVFDLTIQQGMILAGGNFTAYNGTSINRISKLFPNGSIESVFMLLVGNSAFNGIVRTICVQPDGMVLVGGDFTEVNGQTRNRIVRLDVAGNIDTSFNIGTGFSGSGISINNITLQPDGRILVGGGFTIYNGISVNRIVRLNPDGSRDTTFNVGGSSFDGTVNIISLQPDGRILVGGSFTTYNGASANRIVRLNDNGTRDSSFSIGTGFDNATNTIVIQPNGRILVGGSFSTYNSTETNRIVRLLADGQLDPSFNIGTGFNFAVNSIALQPDERVLVGGTFTIYQGSTRQRIIRLNSNGSRDTSFDIGTGFNSVVNKIILNEDKVIVGGDFTSYRGSSFNRIVRLNLDGSIDTTT